MAAAVKRALALVACLMSVGCDWPWRHDMVDQPSPAASQGPRSPAPGAAPFGRLEPIDPAAGEAVVNPIPSDRSTIGTGKALYDGYCVPCHGASGSGRDGAVAKYFPRVGDLTSADLQKHGDGWFYAIITVGTPTMPAYGHELDARERWQIVRFVRTLAH
jgi:mono/diheme cytochrome c family protein